MISKWIAMIGMSIFSMLPASVSTTSVEMNLPIRLPEVVIKAKKIKRTYANSFLGFSLYGRCNTNISKQLEAALSAYTGPEVRITSLRRYWNNHSAHTHGKAVDMEWSTDLIDYLVSEEGSTWLTTHNLMFYIEDRPGSAKLQKYKQDIMYSKYVFENPNATGAHIHIQIK